MHRRQHESLVPWPAAPRLVPLNTESLAVFGQVDRYLSDRLTLTLGGRYTDEDRSTDSNATVLTPYSLEVAGNQVDCPNVNDELDGVGIPIGFNYGPAQFTSSGFFDRSETDFTNGPCYPGQTAAQGCRPATFPNGTVASVQDLAGTPLAYAPEWQFNVRLDGRGHPVGKSLELGYDLFYYWVDDVHFKLTNDPLDTQDACGKVNASCDLRTSGLRLRPFQDRTTTPQPT